MRWKGSDCMRTRITCIKLIPTSQALTHGFETRAIHWTVKGRGSRFLRLKCEDIIINLIIILNIYKNIKLIKNRKIN